MKIKYYVILVLLIASIGFIGFLDFKVRQYQQLIHNYESELDFYQSKFGSDDDVCGELVDKLEFLAKENYTLKIQIEELILKSKDCN
jgi:hypothetical protein